MLTTAARRRLIGIFQNFERQAWDGEVEPSALSSLAVERLLRSGDQRLKRLPRSAREVIMGEGRLQAKPLVDEI